MGGGWGLRALDSLRDAGRATVERVFTCMFHGKAGWWLVLGGPGITACPAPCCARSPSSWGETSPGGGRQQSDTGSTVGGVFFFFFCSVGDLPTSP